AQARAAAIGKTVHVRGIVTLGTGLVDAPTAVIQDPSGAIVLRLGDATAGTSLHRGAYFDVTGTRSTKAGMVTIRADQLTGLGTQPEPSATRVTTGSATERYEARLLVARGAVSSTPIKSTAGNVAFSIDDGSGPLRVTLLAGAHIPTQGLAKGAWVEITGVLGQQTSGSQPDRGYRLWPRDAQDLRIISAAVGQATGSAAAGSTAKDAGVGASSAVPPGKLVKPGLTDRVAAGSSSMPSDGASMASGATGLVGSAGTQDQARVRSSGGSLELASSARPDPRLGLGLLSMAGALAVMFVTLGWRGGTLGRLRAAVPQLVQGEVAADSGTLGAGSDIGPVTW
ncbi:MAG TPA: hypothetical protein VJU79_02190, partial [Candidatus Dormibacteraeota bacterium]|nr:hypothetical protein [Candidatus Dormibacteraeota bacterium]